MIQGIQELKYIDLLRELELDMGNGVSKHDKGQVRTELNEVRRYAVRLSDTYPVY